MGFGAGVNGRVAFGGGAASAPSLASSNPNTGATIPASDRQLRLVLTADHGVGLDIETLEVTLDGTLIYGLGADEGTPGSVLWHPDYAMSYWYLMEDGGYTLVVNNDQDWLRGDHVVVINILDLNGVG